MTKLQEIRDIKLQGTDLDRRSKHQHKEMIAHLYRHKKEYGMKVYDIAKMFDLHETTVWRYAHYERYLKQCNINSKKYQKKIGKEEIAKKNKFQYRQIVEYKTKLYNKMKSKEMKKANI